MHCIENLLTILYFIPSSIFRKKKFYNEVEEN